MSLDAIERAGAGAAVVHLERAAAHLHEAYHQMHLAEIASDLAAITGDEAQCAARLELKTSAKRDAIEFVLSQASSPYRIRECGNVVYLMRDTA